MFLDDSRVIFGHFLRFPDIPGRFRMFPDDSGAFQIVFAAFLICEIPEKSHVCLKESPTAFFVGRKIICWESFEMDFDEVSWGLELISGGKRSFEVWRTYVRTYVFVFANKFVAFMWVSFNSISLL